MKVDIMHDGLLIVPETDFEEQFLKEKFLFEKYEVFAKTGITPADFLGLMIRKKD